MGCVAGAGRRRYGGVPLRVNAKKSGVEPPHSKTGRNAKAHSHEWLCY